MCAHTSQFDPDYAIPPGETIAEIMECKNMSPVEFAALLDLTPEEFSSLLRGEVKLSSTLAQKLEAITEMPADFWNTLESQYRSDLNKEWLSNIPVKELSKRGLIPSEIHPKRMLEAVFDFFGVANLDEWNSIWMRPAVAARRSKCFDTVPCLAATWIRIGEIKAQSYPHRPTDIELFRARIPEMRCLTTKTPQEFIPMLQSICSECGVLLLLIPELPRLPWYGATKWLDRTAIIMLNIRGKSEDKFWFSLFHEIGHVIYHDKDHILINDGSDEDKREKEANDFAIEVLFGDSRSIIPTLKSQSELENFARKIGIAPGIVAGQYQFMTGKYNFFHGAIRKLKWSE